ncbi:MAG TPA: hypothetical protein VFD46_07335 [Chryseolinea sp.]|nr:hypothetical protein [Chryseolinea sp.]
MVEAIRVPEAGDSDERVQLLYRDNSKAYVAQCFLGFLKPGIENPIQRIFDFWKFMSTRNVLLAVVSLGHYSITFSQNVEGTKPAKGADSTYIRTFIKSNDLRIFYGGQGNRLVLGSLRDGSPDLTKNTYNNTNDFIGLGVTYKWLDGDMSFSLPGTTYLNEERSSLDQFKLSGSHTRRKGCVSGLPFRQQRHGGFW